MEAEIFPSHSIFSMASKIDREYLASLAKQCQEKLAADPSDVNKLRVMISQFRVSELTVS